MIELLTMIRNLKNYKLPLIILLFILLSCEHDENSGGFSFDTPFYLKVGELVDINDNVRFWIEKVQDSRCPTEVVCFWAGDAYLFFKIRQYSNQIDTMICSYSCHNNPFQIAGYTWKVLEIDPYPKNFGKIDQDDYRFKIEINKN